MRPLPTLDTQAQTERSAQAGDETEAQTERAAQAADETERLAQATDKTGRFRDPAIRRRRPPESVKPVKPSCNRTSSVTAR
ncbi:hypothetical protein [Burkholderia ambifaria]|uniref:hypothetical protein n=1 Tax=Burkholderia ambifaria TaxID=152480 RepID=UPI0005BE5A99|nr:hypothetical protein [Burkholderia ambifaria]UEP49978.1 hypothetical protein LMA00_23515 [Burkholderia ambifaria]